MARRNSPLPALGLRAHASGAYAHDGVRSIELVFANRSRSRRVVTLLTAALVNSQDPGPPQGLLPGSSRAGQAMAGRGHTFELAPGALHHLRASLDEPGGDHVVALVDVAWSGGTRRATFELYVDERRSPPSAPRCAAFAGPHDEWDPRARDRLSPSPLLVGDTRRDDLERWKVSAWAHVRRSQRAALFEEAWLRAYLVSAQGHPAEGLFEYVHRSVLLLRPSAVGTHFYGEEPGFSVVVAEAVEDALATSRQDKRKRSSPIDSSARGPP